MKFLILITALLVSPFAFFAQAHPAHSAPTDIWFDNTTLEARLNELRSAHAAVLKEPASYWALSARAKALKSLGLTGLTLRDMFDAMGVLKKSDPLLPQSSLDQIATNVALGEKTLKEILHKRDRVCSATDSRCAFERGLALWMTGHFAPYLAKAFASELVPSGPHDNETEQRAINVITAVARTLDELGIPPLD